MAAVTLVAGPFLDADGTARAGELRVSSRYDVKNPDGLGVRTNFRARLDASGMASVTVVSSDQLGLTPANFTYLVQVLFDKGVNREAREVFVSSLLAPSVNIDALPTVVPSDPQVLLPPPVADGIPGPQGPAGPTGPQGPKGDRGDTGLTGADGIMGPAGPRGLQGDAGLDNYELARLEGYGGTRTQYLATLKGDKGDQGVQGIQGERGLQGLRGLQGDAGPAGATGTQGLQGIQGATGATGPKGDTGATGATGERGLQGLQGDPGPQGATGPKGDQGIQGVAGVQGPKGDTGAQGAQGVKGDTGDRGLQGVQGDPGPQGIQGVKGDTGNTGAQGIQGVQGDPGPTGATGPKPLVYGVTSSTSNTVGTGTKSWTVAAHDFVVGDYVRVASTATPTTFVAGAVTARTATSITISGTESSGSGTLTSWTIGLTGVRGLTGNTGAAGLTHRGAWVSGTSYAVNDAVTNDGSLFRVTTANSGTTAPTTASPGANFVLLASKGDQGPQGIQGNTGATGAQGIQGVKGDTGAQGVQGPSGNTGATGPQGATGATGQGFTYRGAWAASTAYAPYDVVTYAGSVYMSSTSFTSGTTFNPANWNLWASKGDTGATGAQGIQGVKGDTGAQGAQGVQGQQGVQGATGATGPAGLTARGAWVSGTSYAVNDVVTNDGSTFRVTAANSGTTAPTTASPGSNFELLASKGAQGPQGIQGTQGTQGVQGVQGNTGATGPSGRSSGTTSTTSNTVTASGSKTFALAAPTSLVNGQTVRVAVSGSPLVNWMDLSLTSVSDTSITGDVTNYAGAGSTSYTSWSIGAGGLQGVQGPTGAQGTAGTNGTNGASPFALSSTSQTIGLGDDTFTLDRAHTFVVGQNVRVLDTTSSGGRWMDGYLIAVSGNAAGSTVTVRVNNTFGSGTYTSWSINAGGERGATQPTTLDFSVFEPHPNGHGYDAWSFDPQLVVGAATATSGTLQGMRFYFKSGSSGVQFNTIGVYVTTAGASLTNVGFIVWNDAGTGNYAQAINVNGATTTAFSSTGYKEIKLSAQYVYNESVLITWWFSGTTIPQLARASAPSVAALSNQNLGNPRLFTGATGLTSTAPSTTGTRTASTNLVWMGLRNT